MSNPASRSGPHTIAEWLAQPQERRVELIDGEFVEKAASSTRTRTPRSTALESTLDGWLTRSA